MNRSRQRIKEALVYRIAEGVRLRNNDVINVLHGYKLSIDQDADAVSVRGDVAAWHAAAHWFAGIYSSDDERRTSRDEVRDIFADPSFGRALRRRGIKLLLWPTSSRKFPFGVTLCVELPAPRQ